MDAAATNLTAQCRRVIGSHLEGEVTQMVQLVIGRYDGNGEFLYKCEGMYGSMSEFVTAYTDGVGSNGDFYSIRGNAWRGFNSSLYLNLSCCTE